MNPFPMHRLISPAALLATMLAAPFACAAPGSVQDGPPTTEPRAQPLATSPARADWRTSFVNPIFEGADPWVVQHDGYYYTTQSEANRGIAVYRSRTLTDLGEKAIIWRAPEEGPHSRQIWAPEIHRIGERWYAYVAASDGRNENHRMIVLESEGDDPQGQYHFKAELYTGDDLAGKTNNRWAIDGVPLELNGQLYHVWSGWADHQDIQYLYIATMSDPWTISSNRVRLADNDDHLWERVDENAAGRGLHEAPQVLQRDGRTFIIYSASGSWQPSYKLGMLELAPAGDPMNPADWKKHPEPVFSPTDLALGTAHCTFITSPDGSEEWMLYHAKVDRQPGWRRAVHAKPFTWGDDGLPDFGTPPAPGNPLPLPSGQPPVAGEPLDAPVRDDFTEPFRQRWQYFGHQQYVGQRDGRLFLGVKPREPVNIYRGGEKALLKNLAFADGTVSASVRVEAGEADAGIMLRVQHPAVGYDAQKGYFVGIVPGTDLVVAGKTDGTRWIELARAGAPIETATDHRLSVEANGSRFTVRLDGETVLRFEDEDYTEGQVGLRVVDTLASFDDVEVKGK